MQASKNPPLEIGVAPGLVQSPGPDALNKGIPCGQSEVRPLQGGRRSRRHLVEPGAIECPTRTRRGYACRKCTSNVASRFLSLPLPLRASAAPSITAAAVLGWLQSCDCVGKTEKSPHP